MLGNEGLYVQQEYSAQFSSLNWRYLTNCGDVFGWKYGQITDNMKLRFTSLAKLSVYVGKAF